MQGQMGSVSGEVGNPKKEPKRNATDFKKSTTITEMTSLMGPID